VTLAVQAFWTTIIELDHLKIVDFKQSGQSRADFDFKRYPM
jgi:hypothetical protein